MNIIREIGDMASDHNHIKRPKVNNLLARLLSALIMLPIAVFAILAGGTPYFIFVILITTLIIFEWNGITEKNSISPLFVLQALSIALLLVEINWGSPYLMVSFCSSLIAIFAMAYLVKAKVIWALAGFFYAFVPSAAILLIGENVSGQIVLWMMMVIWSMDTGAYFVGKNIGGPKMSPSISPNKTWSGLIGGTITAMLVGPLYVYFWGDQSLPIFNNALILIIFSGLVAILGQIGDLMESALKRKFEVKDSGLIIPGHGGVMDRMDGILFVAPVVLGISYILSF